MDGKRANAIVTEHGRALIILLTFATYADTFRFKFVYDDYPQIVVNPRLTSWHYLPKFFTTDVWSHFFSNAAIQYYRPIFSTWLLINYTLFDKHPLGWHFSNVVLHLIATVLVWILAERLTDDSTTAFFAGLIFGLHPVHAEVVAWVSTSSEMLLTIFVLSSLLCLLKVKSTGNRSLCLLGSLTFYVAALLTKETAVVMPAVVFVAAWLYLHEQESRGHTLIASLRCVVPFALLSSIYWLLRRLILPNQRYSFPSYTAKAMVLTWPSLLVRYLKLLILPVGLTEFYDFRSVNSLGLRDFVLPLLLLFFVTVVLFFWWRRSRLRVIPLGSIWILLWLAPVMYIRALQSGEILHDRYLYLPSVGFCLLAGTALTKILAGTEESSASLRTPLTAAALTILLLSLNISQHGFWKDDVALYQRGVRTAPQNGKVKLNLANTLADRGRYEEAVPLYLELLDDPNEQWPILYNLGYSYYQLGRLQDAEKYLNEAIAVDPSNADEHKYAGLTQAKLGRPALAEEHLKTAIRLEPKAAGHHLALAEIYEQQGRTQDALAEFQAELSLTPEDSELKSHIEELEHSSRGHPTDHKPK